MVFKAISEEKKSVCKTQVWVLNNLLIHISEICFWCISLYSLLLFPTYLGVGTDLNPGEPVRDVITTHSIQRRAWLCL